MRSIAAMVPLALTLSALPLAAAETPCTATGPTSVPAETVGGLAEGPHTLVVDGVRLWYCVAGSAHPEAPPLLFLHGGPGEGSLRFAALGGPYLEPFLQVVHFDQRGSGRSERPWTRAYSLDRLVEDVEALRRALDVPRMAVMGHSFGVALALEYAAKYPDHVSHLVLAAGLSDAILSGRSQCRRLAEVNPEAHTRAITAPDGTRATDPANCSVSRAFRGPELEAFFRANMFPDSSTRIRLDSLQAASGLRNTGEMGGALFEAGLARWRFTRHDRLTMPVLIIAGRHDHQVGLEGPQELARALPKARLLIYEQSGHFMYVEEPERFARDVAEFIRPTPVGLR